MKILFHGKEYNFIGKAMVGAHYRFEVLTGHPFRQDHPADALQLYYAILMNDNPDDDFTLTFDQFLADMDAEHFAAMNKQLAEVNKLQSKEREGSKKKKAAKPSPTANSTDD